MLDTAIKVISDELSDYLRVSGRISNDASSPDESVSVEIEPPPKNTQTEESSRKKILISLVNLQEERVLKSQVPIARRQNDQISHVNPELGLTLFILVAVDFPRAEYRQGLGYLSDVIGFFQGKNLFTRENTPSLGNSIEKLIVELHSLNFETQNHLWGVLGTSYLPSIVYRVQTLFIQDFRIDDIQEPIREISITGSTEGTR